MANEKSKAAAERGSSIETAVTWFVYIARCSDGSLYTGIALNVASRIAIHNRGQGARYTRGRSPLALCAFRRCASKGDALRLELAVKSLPRNAKELLLGARRLSAFARRVRLSGAKSVRSQAASSRAESGRGS